MNNDVTMRPDRGSSLGRIDQYELIRELGGGGFGCVYLARDTVAGIEVAVKGLPPLVRLNKEELENVRKNFALVSRLHHPNIAAALHLQKVEKAFYDDKSDAEKLRVFGGDTLVVMQYAPGVTLSQWRKQFSEGKVPLDKALEITRQIASALDYAHEEKILHRDIKPANVMIETGGDGKITARVLDFGLAAEIRSSMSRVSQSITDTSGTRPYMAPEQWLGEEQGKETDQYALAVLFNELVTGKVPFVSVFDTGDPVLMMNVVGNRAFNPPSDLPKPIRLALIKALAKKREDRFESCIAFVDALVGCGAVTAPSGKAFGKIAAVGLLVLGLAGGVWYWQDLKEKEEARIALEQKAELERNQKEEAKRKAAEEARRIAEEKAKKEKVEVERKKKEEAERETEARVADIMVEATVKKNQLLRIDDADGFQDRKTILSDMLTKATAFGKAKQWDKAALNFTNYVEGCNKLITLDGERKAANEKQSVALVSQRQAANAESSKYASVRWGAASDVMEKASEHFSQMEFSEAKGFYESAANQFKLCISEAKNERERQVLEALATNPGKVFKEDFFTPKLKEYEWIYTEISRVQVELSTLLEDYAEGHPEVRAKRMKLNELLEQFVTRMEKEGLGDKARKALKSWAGSEGVIEKPSSDEPSYFTYEVNRGDSLMGVLKKNRVKLSAWREIAKINKLIGGRVSVGQKLKIPKSLLGSAGREEKVNEGNASLNHGDRKILTLPGGETMTMIYVAPGSFMMGSPSSEEGHFKTEIQHYVILSNGYWLCETEVTQAQWNSVMASNPSRLKGEMRPVECVSWNDCQEFVEKINAATNRQLGELRLPTETEWEYACRAGSIGSYGGTGGLSDMGWYRDNSEINGIRQTHNVKEKRANAWGFFDMHGNVNEWCQEVFSTCRPCLHIVRGGGWNDNPSSCRSAYRGFIPPGAHSPYIGFRLACSVEPQKKIDSAACGESRHSISQSVSKVQLWEGGPYWADRNIGADKPEDSGYYFWWGDTVGYKRDGDKWVASDGSRSDFSFCGDNAPTYGKSISGLESEGWIEKKDGTYVLTSKHDAARAHWGGAWRMPTKEELDNLDKKCEWIWDTRNGVNGYVVCGRGNYASKSIFLPAAGEGDGASLGHSCSTGVYWSSVSNSDSVYAYDLLFLSIIRGTSYGNRFLGQPVRPVQGFTK